MFCPFFASLQIERLFQEKFLSQTKNLANGKKIKIFSRKLQTDGSFNYSCHLCGATEVGNEHELHIHVKSRLHSSLMELKIIPLRSWMESVVISDETEKKPCALGCGDCSDLKQLLESVCGIKSQVKKRKEEKITNSNLANLRKSSHRETEEKSCKRKRMKSPSRKKLRNLKEEERFRSRSQSRKSSYRWASIPMIESIDILLDSSFPVDVIVQNPMKIQSEHPWNKLASLRTPAAVLRSLITFQTSQMSTQQLSYQVAAI